MHKKPKRRIFIGFHEIVDYTLRLAQGMRELGYEVTHVIVVNKELSVRSQRAEQPDRIVDYSGNWLKLQIQLFIEFFRVIFTHDVFIFNFGEGFFSTGLSKEMNPILYKFYSKFFDWKIIKFFGKKIIVTLHGCDTRHYTSMGKWANEHGYKYNICTFCTQKKTCYLSIKKQRVKMIEKYADHIIAKSNATHLFTRHINCLMLPINLQTISYKYNTSSKPLIIHAPSVSALKGTKYILKAIERLKNEGYEFEFYLSKNLPHKELMKKMQKSEIVIDQLLAMTPGYSLFSIEGMATGNVVLQSVTPHPLETPKDLPIIPTDPDNIYENLKMLLEDPKRRLQLAKEGRKFVEKHHDHIKVANKFLKEIDLADDF